MPARNTTKIYVADSYYHIYNRGVEKRKIFEDEQDYKVFLSYLKTYLTPKDLDALYERLADPDVTWAEKDKILSQIRLNNFSDEMQLLCYCLMPNHFHLLVKQKAADAIDRFMNSLNTRYVMYFNKKHNRVGVLYQGVYKAVRVETTEQLILLSGYIHTNPHSLSPQGEALQTHLSQPSSLPEYLGYRTSSWIHLEILSFFSKKFDQVSYKNFIENYRTRPQNIFTIALD
jgi:putative transposase